MTSPDTRDGPGRRSHAVLALLATMYADNFIGRQIMAVMIVPIKAEFGIGDTAMGLLSGLAFAVVYGLLGLPFARLADRFSRTRLLAACGLLWVAATVLCGMAGGVLALLLARMLVAVAEAPVTSASLSVIADLYPQHRRGFAISLYTSAPTFASIAALSAGAWLVETVGWRTSFLLIALPVLPVAALLAFLDCEPRRGHWDQRADRPSPALGIIATATSLWSRRSYRLLVLAGAVTAMCGYSFGMWNATFLVRSHHLSLQDAGLLAGLTGGGAAGIGALASGWLTDRLARRSERWYLGLPAIGHILAGAALVAYLLWPAQSSLTIGSVVVPGAIAACSVFSFFSVWWTAPCFTLVTRLVEPGQRAVAMAVQTILSTLLGVGVGPLATGLISDLLAPSLGTDSLRYAMMIAGSATLIPLALFWRTSLHLTQERLPAAQPGIA